MKNEINFNDIKDKIRPGVQYLAQDLIIPYRYEKEITELLNRGLKSYQADYIIKMRNYRHGIKYSFGEWYRLPAGYHTLVYDMEENEIVRAGLFNWYARVEKQLPVIIESEKIFLN
jgi:hypothetical protein